MVSTTLHTLTSSHNILVPCAVEVPTREIFFAAITVLNTTSAIPEEYGKHLLFGSSPRQRSYLVDSLVKEATKSQTQIQPLNSHKVLVYASFPEHFAYLLFLGYLYSIARKAVQEMVLEDFRDISFFSGTYPIRLVNWAKNAQAYGYTENGAVQAAQVGHYSGAYGAIMGSMIAYSENIGIGHVPVPKTIGDVLELQHISSVSHFVPANYTRTAKDDALTGLVVDLDTPLHLNHTGACSLALQVSLTLGGNSITKLDTILSADGTWYTTKHTPFSDCWSFPKIGVSAQLSNVSMIGEGASPLFVSGDTPLLSFFNKKDEWWSNNSIKLFDSRANASSEFKLSPTIIGLVDSSAVL